jgi:DNA repair exonuclease SbcCD ATPase subunit
MEWKTGNTWRGYRFATPTTVVTGPVGSAKSTLCEFISYATGTPARLMPAVVKSFSAVRLRAQVGPHRLELERSLRKADAERVSVRDLDGRLADQVFPVFRTTADETTLSDFILDALEIPRVALPGAHGNELTLSQVFTVLYLAQRRISTQLLGVDKKIFPSPCVATLDVLLGVDNGQGAAVHRQIQEVNRQLGGHTSYVANVRRFLAGSSSDQASLEQQQNDRRRRHAELLHESDLIGKQLADTDLEDRKLLEHLMRSRARQPVEERRERDLLTRVNLLIEKKTRLVADIAHLELTRAQPTHCSACQQALIPLAAEEQGKCPQCRRAVTSNTTDHVDGQQYRSDLAAVQESLDQANAQLASLQQAKTRESAELANAIQALQQLRESVIQPLNIALRETEKRAAEIREEIAEAEAHRKQWAVIAEHEAKVHDLRNVLADLKQGLREWEADRARKRRSVTPELTGQFTRILDLIGMPGNNSAYIDPVTYSPIVGTDGFTELAVSGGRKTQRGTRVSSVSSRVRARRARR